MSSYLLVSTPLQGHVAPLVAVGRDLARRGHTVTFVSGSRFRAGAEAAGMSFRALEGIADFDEAELSTYLPDADRYRGVRLSRYQVEQTFVRPIPDQWRSVRAAIEDTEPDAVVVDCMFVGVLPLLVQPTSTRPPVVALGISPLPQRSRNTAPYNMALKPSWSTLGIVRNQVLHTVAAKVLFAPTQRLAERLVADSLGGPPATALPSILDLPAVFDRYLSLGPAELEYPIADLAPNVRFVGPVAPVPQHDVALPSWWSELDDGRPVVHVTQGTLANADLGMLVRPTIEALADEEVHVVVSTGGAPVASLGELPARVHVAPFLPYDQLLPRTDVLVTNGGFGTTLMALGHGIPLVVAPGAEDKPEVAARVEHFGVGIDLRTSSPAPGTITDAVRRVLHERSFAERSTAMAEAIAGYDALSTIDEELAALTTSGRRPGTGRP